MFFAIGTVVVLGIAFVTLGWVLGRLEHERAPAVYRLEDAVEWIVDRLPDEITAQLSYGDVRKVLLWHLDWFTEIGVSSQHGNELAGDDMITHGAIAGDVAAVDAIVARGQQSGIEAIDVVCVLDLQMRYLAHIGAVGSTAVDQLRIKPPDG